MVAELTSLPPSQPHRREETSNSLEVPLLEWGKEYTSSGKMQDPCGGWEWERGKVLVNLNLMARVHNCSIVCSGECKHPSQTHPSR